MEKILYLMRHGQTLFNLEHKIQGWCDSPLTELGLPRPRLRAATLQITRLSWTTAMQARVNGQVTLWN